MKKIISSLLLVILIFSLSACTSKTEVVYEEDYDRYSDITSADTTGTDKLKEDYNIVDNTDETNTNLENIYENTKVNYLDAKSTETMVKNTSGVLLISSKGNEKTREIIDSLSMVVSGGGYPLNYYELGQDDNKVKKVLGNSVQELKDPMLVFVKNGSIVSVKDDFSNFEPENFYSEIKEDIYKTYEE